MRDSIESVQVSCSRNTFGLLHKGVVVLRGFERRHDEDLPDRGLTDPCTILCHFT